jgi:hypothetical protein
MVELEVLKWRMHGALNLDNALFTDNGSEEPRRGADLAPSARNISIDVMHPFSQLHLRSIKSSELHYSLTDSPVILEQHG